MPDSAADPFAPLPVTRRERRVILGALMLGTFLASLEVTIVGTAMPTIVARLGGLDLYAWVAAVYLLTSTTTMPLYGKVADLYGRRPVLLAGLFLFMLGSALCGLAGDMYGLIAFRAVQGLGAGAVVPTTLTLIGDLHTPAERPRVQSMFSLIWGGSAVVGPFVGAFLVEHVSWRAVFYVNIPFGLMAMAVLWFRFHERRPELQGSAGRPKLDLPGAALLVTGCTALLLGLQASSRPGAGSSLSAGMPQELLLALGAVLLFLFVLWERRAPEPVLPPRLFRSRPMALAMSVGLFSGAVLYALMNFVPVAVQGVKQSTPLVAGTVLLTIAFGWTGSSLVVGRYIQRWGERPFILFSAVVGLGGTLLLLDPGPATPLARVVAGMVMVGTGMGTVTIAMLVAIQNRTPWRDRGVATSAFPFFRTIGGSLGVGLCGALLNLELAGSVDAPLRVALAAEHLHSVAKGVQILLDPEHRTALPASLRERLAEALAAGLEPVMWTVAICAALWLLLSLPWPAGDPPVDPG